MSALLGTIGLERWKALARRLGAPGLSAAVLLIAASLVQLAALPPLEKDIAALQRLARERRALAMTAASPAASAATAAGAETSSAAARLQGFPPAADRRARVLALMRQADRHGLSPQRGEYRLTAGALDQYRIAMPLEGRYPALRAFVEAALRADPALSLDSLQLRRAGAAQELVKAELSWTLYAQGATAPSSEAPTRRPEPAAPLQRGPRS